MDKTKVAEIFAYQTIGPSSWLSIVFTLILAFLAGIFIFWVYKTNYKGVMFSTNFGLTLIIMTIVTAPVVMCIKDSLSLSMGMVGALSIVRFRTAVKDPMDTAYMFWALTMGIMLGAGQYFMAAFATLGIAALIFGLRFLTSKPSDSFLLVMRVSAAAESAVGQVVRQLNYQKLKSKTITKNGVEITFEIRTAKSEQLLNKLLSLNGVNEASLIAYQSETA